MEGDAVGILRAGERENTDQAEKDRGNVIHQTSCDTSDDLKRLCF